MLDLKKLLTKILQELKYSKLNTSRYTSSPGNTVSFVVDDNTGQISVTSQGIQIAPSQIDGNILASQITGLPTIPTASTSTTATAVTASTVGNSGTATTWARSDHEHNINGNTITSALGYTPSRTITTASPILSTTTTAGIVEISHKSYHDNEVVYGTTAAATPKFGDSVILSDFRISQTGHIVKAHDHNVTIPNSVATLTQAGLMSTEDKLALETLKTLETSSWELIDSATGSTTISITPSDFQKYTFFEIPVAISQTNASEVILHLSKSEIMEAGHASSWYLVNIPRSGDNNKNGHVSILITRQLDEGGALSGNVGFRLSSAFTQTGVDVTSSTSWQVRGLKYSSLNLPTSLPDFSDQTFKPATTQNAGIEGLVPAPAIATTSTYISYLDRSQYWLNAMGEWKPFPWNIKVGYNDSSTEIDGILSPNSIHEIAEIQNAFTIKAGDPIKYVRLQGQAAITPPDNSRIIALLLRIKDNLGNVQDAYFDYSRPVTPDGHQVFYTKYTWGITPPLEGERTYSAILCFHGNGTSNYSISHKSILLTCQELPYIIRDAYHV